MRQNLDIRRITRVTGALVGIVMAMLASAPQAAGPAAAAPNGITLPPDYRNWRLIASSHRHDNNTLRVILGNDTAIDAARTGNTNPWPEGTILCKLVWKDAIHEHWEKAVIPGEFVHAEFMVKDGGKYRETGGWGFARWLGMNQQPYGTDAAFAQECFGCHIPMKDNDYVFTHPAKLP
jgi:Cytochrome P460